MSYKKKLLTNSINNNLCSCELNRWEIRKTFTGKTSIPSTKATNSRSSSATGTIKTQIVEGYTSMVCRQVCYWNHWSWTILRPTRVFCTCHVITQEIITNFSYRNSNGKYSSPLILKLTIRLELKYGRGVKQKCNNDDSYISGGWNSRFFIECEGVSFL